MTQKNNNHGGPRPNSGRPSTDRKVALSVRISQEAADILQTVTNKSEYIDQLIKHDHDSAGND